MLEEALLRAVVGRAGQPGQVDENGDLLAGDSLRREVEVERHLAFGGSRGMAQLEQFAAEGGDGSLCGDSHGDGDKDNESREDGLEERRERRGRRRRDIDG